MGEQHQGETQQVERPQQDTTEEQSKRTEEEVTRKTTHEERPDQGDTRQNPDKPEEA